MSRGNRTMKFNRSYTPRQKLLFIIPFLALLDGCTPSVPKCGDSKTINLVKQIAKEDVEKNLGARLANTISYSVSAIRTTNTHEKTGAFECAAQLEVHSSATGRSNRIPITYTVEATDKGDEFYVGVRGLE